MSRDDLICHIFTLFDIMRCHCWGFLVLVSLSEMWPWSRRWNWLCVCVCRTTRVLAMLTWTKSSRSQRTYRTWRVPATTKISSKSYTLRRLLLYLSTDFIHFASMGWMKWHVNKHNVVMTTQTWIECVWYSATQVILDKPRLSLINPGHPR